MIDKNVVLRRSAGGPCGICDDPIKKDAVVIKVTFEVPIMITTVNVDREMHLECGERLSDTLRRRLKEAGWR